jgi:MOSC domain-containing protein YiiM
MKSKLLSLQVGVPKKYPAPQGEWVSGIWKHPVEGAVYASRTGLSGDGQGDLSVHGGLDKAIYVYPESHYSYWRQDLSQPDLPYGAFGENFTVTGFTEGTVCIGDVFRVGETVTVEVSEPRGPCWKLARRLDVKDIVVRVNETGYSGWYFRVLQEGEVAAGMDIILLERPYPQWTVTSANQALHDTAGHAAEARGLIACPALAESWRKGLRYQLKEAQSSR